MIDHPNLPSPCPCCGAYSLSPDSDTTALFAVCEVLTVKSLEQMGKWIVRAERSRFRALGTRPFYVAHTLWPPEEATVRKALRNAWDVVPALLAVHGTHCGVTPRQVTTMLDEYVRDLVITGTEHKQDELAYRFGDRLGIPLPEPLTREGVLS